MTVRATGARFTLFCISMTALLAVATPTRSAEPAPAVGMGRTVAPGSGRLAVSPLPAFIAPRQHDSAAAVPARPRPWWGWLLLGRMHPVVVHFPIALLTAAAMVEAWRAVRGRPLPSEAGTYCLAFGVAGAVAAVCLGTLNAGHQVLTGDAAAALERHQIMGWISTTAAMAALGAGQMARRAGGARTVAAYVCLLLATGAVVGATGHLGAGLVYGDDYLTGVLPWNQRTASSQRVGAATPTATAPVTAVSPTLVASVTPHAGPSIATRGTEPARVAAAPASAAGAEAPAVVAQDEAVDFARDVMPIIKRTCVECHGPDKVKARLRMDSVEGLQKGGKSGALLKPGDPENSLIVRRVLGLDGEDRMPLDKDPLTEKQIDALRRWIAAGAPYPAAGSQ